MNGQTGHCYRNPKIPLKDRAKISVIQSPKSQGDMGEVASLDEENEGFYMLKKISNKSARSVKDDSEKEEIKEVLIPSYSVISPKSDNSPRKPNYVGSTMFPVSLQNGSDATFAFILSIGFINFRKIYMINFYPYRTHFHYQL